MSRFFLGFLALSALALMIGQATAGNNAFNSASQSADGGAVMIIETYTASANVPSSDDNNNFQPLPGDPGVEVAPAVTASSQQPAVIEEDTFLEQSDDGE